MNAAEQEGRKKKKTPEGSSRKNTRINEKELAYIHQIKERLNQELEKSEIKYAQLYKKTQELGYSFSNKTLYHVLSYQETSLNIMAVLAICQVLEIDTNWLFSRGEVEDKLILPPEEKKIDREYYAVLTDQAYMNTYYCYLHKPTYSGKYEAGTLTISRDEEKGSQAVLELHDSEGSGYRKTQEKRYVGTPVICRSEGVIFITLTCERGRSLFLSFSYIDYRSTSMYFRMASAIVVNPLTKTPQFQNMVLSLRKLEPEEIPYMKGLLKVMPEEVVIPGEDLEALFEKYADLDFMQQFRKEFLPLLQILKKDCYIFKATELIAYTGSNMKKENRLRAIMLIKQAACASEEINNEHDNQGVDGVQRLFKTGILKGIEKL